MIQPSMSSSKALSLASSHASFGGETSPKSGSKILVWHQASESGRGGSASVELEFRVARWRVRLVIFEAI